MEKTTAVYELFLDHPRKRLTIQHKLLWDTLTPEQQIALIVELTKGRVSVKRKKH